MERKKEKKKEKITNFVFKKYSLSRTPPLPTRPVPLHVLFISRPFFPDMQPTLFSLSIHQNLHFLFQRETTSFFPFDNFRFFFKKMTRSFYFLSFCCPILFNFVSEKKKKNSFPDQSKSLDLCFFSPRAVQCHFIMYLVSNFLWLPGSS